MEKTPMPVVAGILNIVSGVLSVLSFIGLLIGAIAVGSTAIDITGWIPGMGFALTVLIILAIVFLVTGVFALVGGIFAMQRTRWSWVLAGSICAIVPSIVLGIISIILVTMSRTEFEEPEMINTPENVT